jgi:NAD(P)-dependent dehydrogenase (short-subunit alcohol dehydrogenase family)
VTRFKDTHLSPEIARTLQSDDTQVAAAMVDRTIAEFGRIDAAFNNAGVMARTAPIADRKVSGLS